MGADLAYMGTRFLASKEANAPETYKQMIIDSAGDDIIYSSLFTGIHGNYLKGSVRAAGLDPDELPSADKTAMNFGGGSDAKAWKDIWGSGQGVGSIHDAPSVAQIVDDLKAEYASAKKRLAIS